MSQIQKYMFAIIIFLLVTVLAFDASLYVSIAHTPNQVKIEYKTLKDNKIPESLNDVSIVYITDLQYGKYQNDQRTEKVFNKIKELNPDILIFGGDLFDSTANINKTSKDKLVKYFSSIEAPMGKYAVWGEKDWIDSSHKSAVKDIYYQSQIELLHNTNVRISAQDKKSIRLIGLTSTSATAKALDGVSAKTYNILVTHKPDNFMAQALANHSISYGLAGHSHGTQVTFPIMGPYKEISGATKINRERHKNLSFPYIVNPGLGCTTVDMRYGATPEINIFILKH